MVEGVTKKRFDWRSSNFSLWVMNGFFILLLISILYDGFNNLRLTQIIISILFVLSIIFNFISYMKKIIKYGIKSIGIGTFIFSLILTLFYGFIAFTFLFSSPRGF